MIIDARTKQVLSTFFGNGSTHDLTVFRLSKQPIHVGTLLLGDLGYVGVHKSHLLSRVPHKKSCKRGLSDQERALTCIQKQENRALSGVRIGIEHVNRRLKIFKILGDRYRNRCPGTHVWVVWSAF